MLNKIRKQYAKVFPKLNLSEAQEFHKGVAEENFRRSLITTSFIFVMANVFLISNYWVESLQKQYFWNDVILWLASLILIRLGVRLKEYQAAFLHKNIFVFVVATFLMSWGASISVAELSSFGNFFTYLLAILSVSCIFYFSSLSLTSIFLLSFLWLINSLVMNKVNFTSHSLWVNGFTILVYLSFVWIISRILYSYRLHYFVVQRKLKHSNQELQQEHKTQLKLTQELQKLTQVQEDRIQNRTKGLAKANQALKAEIYERRQIERALRESKTTLEEQNEILTKLNIELDKFVYRTSHDLRAPLTSGLGLISLLEENIDPDQHDYYLHLLKQSLLKVDFFIHDIVDYSQNSRYTLNIQSVNLSELCHSILENLRSYNQTQEVEIILDNSAEAYFYSDPMRLRLILNNLLTNAYTFSKLGFEDAFIKLSLCNPAPNRLLIEVEDNGEGIAEEHLPHIFEMFYRASTRSQGSGLGLYILKNALERLQGSINIHSIKGEGTKVQVTILDAKTLSEDRD